MDINLTLLLIAVASCVVLLVRTVPLRRRGRGAGWIVVATCILAVAGVGEAWFPNGVGLVVGTLWAVFIALPSLLARLVLRHALGQRYERAERLAKALRCLHPADGWREWPEVYRALRLAQAGQIEAAAAVFGAIMARPGVPPSVVLNLRVDLYRLRGQWEEFLAWTEAAAEAEGPERHLVASDPNVLLMRVRACGETGRLGDLLVAFQAARPRLERAVHPSLWPVCQLNLFAFGGREAATAGLLDGPLAGLTPETRAFWRATARMAAGQSEAARADLRALADRSDDQGFRQVVERRLTRDLAVASRVFSSEETALLDRIETERDRDHAYHPPAVAGWRRAHATNVLILLNLGVFALEMVRGGSQNFRTLSRLGALWSPAVLGGGQWYRLVTALFLHFGAVHLVMNLLGLGVIGPWVEKTLGQVRYTAVYFVSGTGSMAAVLFFIRQGWLHEELLVGASGAIMGLIGATGALLLAGWRRGGSALAARRLRGVGLIVALQVIFDLLTPQVSFAAHAAGVLLGFLVTASLPGQGRNILTNPQMRGRSTR